MCVFYVVIDHLKKIVALFRLAVQSGSSERKALLASEYLIAGKLLWCIICSMKYLMLHV